MRFGWERGEDGCPRRGEKGARGCGFPWGSFSFRTGSAEVGRKGDSWGAAPGPKARGAGLQGTERLGSSGEVPPGQTEGRCGRGWGLHRAGGSKGRFGFGGELEAARRVTDAPKIPGGGGERAPRAAWWEAGGCGATMWGPRPAHSGAHPAAGGPSASVQWVPGRTAASSSTPPEGTPQAPDLLLR